MNLFFYRYNSELLQWYTKHWISLSGYKKFVTMLTIITGYSGHVRVSRAPHTSDRPVQKALKKHIRYVNFQ